MKRKPTKPNRKPRYKTGWVCLTSQPNPPWFRVYSSELMVQNFLGVRRIEYRVLPKKGD